MHSGLSLHENLCPLNNNDHKNQTSNYSLSLLNQNRLCREEVPAEEMSVTTWDYMSVLESQMLSLHGQFMGKSTMDGLVGKWHTEGSSRGMICIHKTLKMQKWEIKEREIIQLISFPSFVVLFHPTILVFVMTVIIHCVFHCNPLTLAFLTDFVALIPFLLESRAHFCSAN